MSNLNTHVKLDKIKWIITAILLIALIGAVAFMGVKLNRVEKTKNIGSTSYSIGTINSTGKYAEDNKSVYTKDYIKVDGLTVTVKDDPTITYQLHFYTENKTFISSTTASAVNYTGTVPATAVYVRISIHSTGEYDLTIFTQANVSNQLKVTVNK